MDVVRRQVSLESLGRAFVERGRLQAIASFFESSLEQRNLQCAPYVASFDTASRIFEFCRRHFCAAEPKIYWSKRIAASENYAAGVFSVPQVEEDIKTAETEILAATKRLKESMTLEADGQALNLLRSISYSISDDPTSQLAACHSSDWKREGPIERILHSPAEASLDGVFLKTYSITTRPFTGSEYSDNLSSLARAFWTTAMHEGLASRLCIITLFEYDGLPFSFYHDITKQAADEANHAVRFLQCARLLITELSQSDQYWANLRDRLENGEACLDVPVEGDFYTSIRTADLRTRITWMHVDTEGPGVGALINVQKYGEVAKREIIHQALGYVIQDEVTHARFGRHWIRELEGEIDQMDLEDARLLRGLLLSETVASSRNMDFIEFLKDEIGNQLIA